MTQRTGSRSNTTVYLDGQILKEAAALPQGANGGLGREWVTFTRHAPLELTEEGDGRTLYGRVVPYNVVAIVADPPHFKPYRESFAPGAFRAQLQAANRIDVLLNYEHRQGISDVVGRGVSLQDEPDGLYGTFRILEHPDGDKALELAHAGVLRGMSTEFSARKSRTTDDGVLERVDARVSNVALTRAKTSNHSGPKAAYQGAEVLSIRTDEPPDDDEPAPEPLPEPAVSVQNPDLMARLAALGVEPILARVVTRKPWDGSPGRFTDDEYKRSTLVCRGTGAPPKQDCSLPVLEPNGDVNANALADAAGRLNQADLTGSQKATAARKLIRYYRQAQMEPPPRIVQMAGQ